MNEKIKEIIESEEKMLSLMKDEKNVLLQVVNNEEKNRNNDAYDKLTILRMKKEILVLENDIKAKKGFIDMQKSRLVQAQMKEVINSQKINKDHERY